MENAVVMRNVTKRYRGFCLDNVSLEIPKGYITGIIGRNGAGKTTLINSILGITCFEGEIEIFGKPLCGNEIEIKNKIGAALGNGFFYEGLTLRQTAGMLKRFYENWSNDDFFGYMRRFGLDTNKKVKELSTGMREKFAIAAALSHNAELIIMDEPSSGLDPVARGELTDIFADVIGDGEKTVVISTHITSDLDRTADFIVMIDGGRVVFNMQKDELTDSHRIVKGPADALTSELKRQLISCRTGARGFEGLIRTSARIPGLVYEKPTIEDIMRAYAKKGTEAESNV